MKKSKKCGGLVRLKKPRRLKANSSASPEYMTAQEAVEFLRTLSPAEREKMRVEGRIIDTKEED